MLHLPENTHDLYNKALSIGTAPVFWDALMPALHYKLRTTSIEELKEIAEVTRVWKIGFSIPLTAAIPLRK